MIEALNRSIYYKESKQLNNKSSDRLVCPECGSTNFTYDPYTYETLCFCGCVVDENLIDSNFSGVGVTRDGQSKNYSGKTSSSLHDKGLSTYISNSTQGISNKNRLQFYRLRKLQKSSKINGNKERNLAMAFNKLITIKVHLNLPNDVKDSAALLYRKALNDNLIHGRSIDAIVASCVYIACKQAKIPRNFKEISEISNIDTKTIASYSRLLTKQFNLKFTATSPRDYIPRFVSNLKLSNNVEVIALDYIYKVEGNPILIGKPSASFAAAAIYLACKTLKVKKSQKEISDVTNVSEVTIRKRYKDLKPFVC